MVLDIPNEEKEEEDLEKKADEALTDQMELIQVDFTSGSDLFLFLLKGFMHQLADLHMFVMQVKKHLHIPLDAE
ncbi:hypothetical protein NC651_014749 [Populus alba x Populus x berolinensis]|nr:hypothetical protein NC651_014749 [Populus alba x Populus x berolinensis]